jgi:hypothetical protein
MSPTPLQRRERGGKKGGQVLRGKDNTTNIQYNPFLFFLPDFYIWFKYVAKKKIFEIFILEIAKIG